MLCIEVCIRKSDKKERVESGKKRCRWRLNNIDWSRVSRRTR